MKENNLKKWRKFFLKLVREFFECSGILIDFFVCSSLVIFLEIQTTSLNEKGIILDMDMLLQQKLLWVFLPSMIYLLVFSLVGLLSGLIYIFLFLMFFVTWNSQYLDVFESFIKRSRTIFILMIGGPFYWLVRYLLCLIIAIKTKLSVGVIFSLSPDEEIKIPSSSILKIERRLKEMAKADEWDWFVFKLIRSTGYMPMYSEENAPKLYAKYEEN